MPNMYNLQMYIVLIHNGIFPSPKLPDEDVSSLFSVVSQLCFGLHYTGISVCTCLSPLSSLSDH